MKHKILLILFSVLLMTPFYVHAQAQTCVEPPLPNCRTTCAGLPSYPTFQFESCLTSCDNNYSTADAAYQTCLDQQYQQQQAAADAAALKQQQEADAAALKQQQDDAVALAKQQADTATLKQQQDDAAALAKQQADAAALAKQQADAAALKKKQDAATAKQNANKITERTVFYGQDLKDGQTLKSGLHERINIELGDGSVITLEPNSSIMLTKLNEYETLKGKFDFIFKSILKGQRPIRIRSRTAVIGVRGTKFTTLVDNSKTMLQVTEGLVDASTVDGKKTVKVLAGYQTTITKNKILKPSKFYIRK